MGASDTALRLLATNPTNFPEARFWIVSGFADNPPIWTVPSGGATLDLIGAPGSNRDFFGAVVCF